MEAALRRRQDVTEEAEGGQLRRSLEVMVRTLTFILGSKGRRQ